MATIIKRGDSWFVQVRKKGVSKSKSFKTKAQAVNWAAMTETAINNGTLDAVSEKTFADALNRYVKEVSINKRGQRWEVIRVAVWLKLPFAHYKIGSVSTPILANWRDDRLKAVKSSTVNREMNFMASVFEQARREWQWISVNPMRDVKRPANPQHRERIFMVGFREKTDFDF